MSWVPVPGFGAGDLSPDGNLAAHLDRLVLGVHMWSGGGGVYDPEGLLSTLPAVASTLAGLFAGDFLRAAHHGPSDAAGTGTVASLRMLMAGLALVLAALHWLIDVRGRRGWALPLVVYGMNGSLAFAATTVLFWLGVLWVMLALLGTPRPEGVGCLSAS